MGSSTMLAFAPQSLPRALGCWWLPGASRTYLNRTDEYPCRTGTSHDPSGDGGGLVSAENVSHLYMTTRSATLPRTAMNAAGVMKASYHWGSETVGTIINTGMTEQQNGSNLRIVAGYSSGAAESAGRCRTTSSEALISTTFVTAAITSAAAPTPTGWTNQNPNNTKQSVTLPTAADPRSVKNCNPSPSAIAVVLTS